MAESFRSPRKIARRLKLLPLAARKIHNWPNFMYHYALGLKPRGFYVFRNGAKMRIGRGIDHVPLIEIFLREDYGAMPDNATIIDLGANIGAFTMYAAATTRKATIYAYEPMHDFYNLLEDNVRLNGKADSVKCFNYAVAGKAETRTLYTKGTDFYFPTLIEKADKRAEQETVAVKCITLADIIESNNLQKVDMLKLDCEGAEYEILYSAPDSCFEKIKEIRMEFHNLDQKDRHLDGLKSFLAKKGYEFTHIEHVSDTNGTLWARKT